MKISQTRKTRLRAEQQFVLPNLEQNVKLKANFCLIKGCILAHLAVQTLLRRFPCSNPIDILNYWLTAFQGYDYFNYMLLGMTPKRS